MEYNTYWGGMHNQHSRSNPSMDPERVRNGNVFRSMERAFEAARENLDFLPIVYYPAGYYEMMEGLRVESQGPRETFARDWERVLELVRRYNAPGQFITFPGYEWTGNRLRYGDHNIFYFDEGPLDLSWGIEELFANLRQRRAIPIPHHTGYQVGQRGKDWDIHDEQLSPFVEIFSVHGSSEGCNTPFSMVRNGSMGPRVSGGTVQDGLRRGYRLGISASNDGNGVAGAWGDGLMAVLAPELTGEALWEAFMARRVYGVTGDRIQLDFSINGKPMGSTIHSEGAPRLHVSVVCSQALDRIEILRNNRVTYTHCHAGTWEVPRGDQPVRAKVKVECGWGPNPMYGLIVEPKSWEGELTLADGQLLSVEPCFTYWGQKVGPLNKQSCCWHLTTAQRRQNRAWGPSQQALIFEVEMFPQSSMTLRVNGREERFSLAEAMAGSRVIGFVDETKELIEKRFLLRPEEIENPDVFWHHAYKVKIHTAIPEVGFTTAFEWVDEDMPSGRNWYYLRISEQNGQMAWSSPIWVEPG